MTGPADPELRDRLARLAAAVPVNEPVASTPEAGRLVRGPVVWRRSGPSRLAIATVVVAVLAVAVWGGVSGRIGPAGPSANSVVSDGTFELSFSASKSRYSESEPIVAKATLTYLGSDPSITIFHGLGADHGPIAFAIDEPVPLPGGGAVKLEAVVRESCVSSVLRPGVPLGVAFAKSGGSDVDASPMPSDDVVQAFFGDPILRLPAGTWHLVALANLSLGGCGGEKHQLMARITITVGQDGIALVSPSPSHDTPASTVSPSPTVPQATAPTFPGACAALDVSLNQCAGFAAWAVGQSGIAPGHVRQIEMTRSTCPGASPCPSGAAGYVVSVHIQTDSGAPSDELVDCTRMPGSLGGINFLCDVMTTGDGRVLQYPNVRSSISGGYRDVPCSGEGPTGCATPLPSIEPSAAAAAQPLVVASRDFPIDHAGTYSIELGEATLPNGVLTAASAEVTSSPADPLVSYDGYALSVTSLDGGPPFESYYAHGWRPGVEHVKVTLSFTILLFQPGAAVRVESVDVH